MESEQSRAARQAVREFEQLPKSAIAAETAEATPAWGILSVGLWGPALVAFYSVSGFWRALVPLLLLVPSLVFLAAFNVRLRRRVQLRPTARTDVQKNLREVGRKGRRRGFLVTFGNIMVWMAIVALAKTDITRWLIVPTSFVAMTSTLFLTELHLQNLRSDDAPATG